MQAQETFNTKVSVQPLKYARELQKVPESVPLFPLTSGRAGVFSAAVVTATGAFDIVFRFFLASAYSFFGGCEDDPTSAMSLLPRSSKKRSLFSFTSSDFATWVVMDQNRLPEIVFCSAWRHYNELI